MRSYLIVLSLALWVCPRVEAQSVSEAFPDFVELKDVRHYDVNPQQSFPLRHGIKKRPDVEAWIEALRPVAASGESLRVSIYRQSESVLFVRERYKGEDGQDRLYRISNNSIDFILPRVDGEGLWENQLGIARWGWRFDQNGKLLEEKYFRWSRPNQEQKLEWISVKRTTSNTWENE